MKEKIRIWDLIRNSDGKLSGSGTSGVLMIFVSCLCLMSLIVAFYLNKNIEPILGEVITFAGIGAGLLGIRKFKAKTQNDKDEKEI